MNSTQTFDKTSAAKTSNCSPSVPHSCVNKWLNSKSEIGTCMYGCVHVYEYPQLIDNAKIFQDKYLNTQTYTRTYIHMH